jgi:potassium-transporting ATPase KdpC subunit
MKELLRSSVLLLVLLSALTGVIYPLAVTGAAQALFPRQSGGDLVEVGGHPAGSELIGQPFDDPRYFWGRPSATPVFPCNAASSGGSNRDLNNPALTEAVRARAAALRAADPGNDSPIPVDLVTGSGSGLDPDISPSAAEFQVPRVARARGLTEETVRRIVAEHTAGRMLKLLGEPRVNVLELNLALDARSARPGGAR